MATKGYTFCIESNSEEIVNTPALTTLIKENLKLENDIIVIKSRLKANADFSSSKMIYCVSKYYMNTMKVKKSLLWNLF